MSSESTCIVLTRNGIADRGQEASLAQLRQRLSLPNSQLLLHLHGGLVPKKDGIKAAERLSGQGDESWHLGEEWTQLYVVWRTGALDTLRTNWVDLVHNDRLYQSVLRRLIAFVGRRLGIRLPGGKEKSFVEGFDLDDDEIMRRILGDRDRRAPFGEIDGMLSAQPDLGTIGAKTFAVNDAQLASDFEDELAMDVLFQAAITDIDNAYNAGLPGRAKLADIDAGRGKRSLERLSASIRSELEVVKSAAGQKGLISVGMPLLKHAGKVAWRVFRRYRTGRHHNFHATLVEELVREYYLDRIGGAIWGMMVKDAADHFEDSGFGITLLDLLREVPPSRLSITAHSAGSIWAMQMLLKLHHRQQTQSVRLFLLAPAVRTDLFAQALTVAEDRIETCSMFTMSDAFESKDPVLKFDHGYIYPSSLLYCVSGMFEDRNSAAYVDAPLVGMRRFAGAPWLTSDEAADGQIISNFFARPGNGIVTSVTKEVCEAIHHGDFDNEQYTLKSVTALL